MRKKATVRQVVSLAGVPPFPPKRYASDSRGYIRLRWKIAPYTYLECYEHRLLAGFPPEIVHHDNEIKDDNSSMNLVPLTRSDHTREHHQQADDALISSLYLAGLSTYKIAPLLKLDPATIWRSLRRSGTETRSRQEAANLGGCGV